MAKALPLIFLVALSMVLVSGCSSEPGKTTENTAITVQDAQQQDALAPEDIEELHKEFADFEKSHAENTMPSEQSETANEPITENLEGAEGTPPEEGVAPEEEIPEQTQKQCPSCDDGDSCTSDSCSEDTGYECVHKPVIPCCGNGGCEDSESWSSCPEDCECSLGCGPCETPDNESCSCLPKTECSDDGCCPEGCSYPEDPDCPKPSAIFSEIYYNPEGSDPGHEWAEIYNNGTVPIDVTGLRFEESGVQHRITAAGEAVLGPGSYSVIADNSTQFILDYPGYDGMLFDSSFSLSNSGEELVLRAGKDGDIMDSVTYNSTWGGDGSGFSLEKMDMGGPNTAENWNQSLSEKGTPGQQNSIAI